MRVIGLILRAFSILFHILLSLFMMGVGAVAWLSGNESLQIGLLPWKGSTLTYWLFFLGLAGFLVTLMAVWRVLPVLFFLWSLLVLVGLVRGYFFSTYNFGLGGGSIATALEFVAAALVAAIGSWIHLRRPAARRRAALA